MAKNVIMPVLGMAQDSGVVVQWLVADGQPVREGDPLLEVETDKAVVEVPAMASGVLAHVTAREGDEVPTGTVIAVLLGEDEAAGYGARDGGSGAPALGGAPSGASASSAPSAPSTPSAPSAPSAMSPAAPNAAPQAPTRSEVGVARSHSSGWGQPAPQVVMPPARDHHRLMASPKAKRLARELGLDLNTVAGSGPAGAVRAVDILALLSGGRTAAAPSAAGAGGSAQSAPASGDLSSAVTWLRTDAPLAPLHDLVDRANAYLERNGPWVKVEASDVLVQLTLAALVAVGAGRPEIVGLTRSTEASGNGAVGLTGSGSEAAVLNGAGLRSLAAIAQARAEGGVSTAAATALADLHVLDLSASAFESALPPLPVGCRLRVTLAKSYGATGISGTLTLEYRPEPPVDPAAFLTRLRQLFEDPLGALLYV